MVAEGSRRYVNIAQQAQLTVAATRDNRPRRKRCPKCKKTSQDSGLFWPDELKTHMDEPHLPPAQVVVKKEPHEEEHEEPPAKRRRLTF